MNARRGTSSMHGAGQREYLTDDFLRRVHRAYKLGLEHQRAGAGEIWGSIRTLQQSVHEALVSEDTEALREIFRDPLRSDLYYGVDHACRSFAAQPIAGDYDDVMMIHIRAVSTALNIPRPDNPEEFLSAIDALLGHHVELPPLATTEVGIRTSKGVLTYRALHAMYQARRLIEIAGSTAASVIEIGPGAGRTAYYAYRAGFANYTTVDLPMGIVAQARYLAIALGADRIWLPGDGFSDQGRIKLLFDRPTRNFDIALNADSITEMPALVALAYARWIGTYARQFFSINHETNRFTSNEIARAGIVCDHIERRECLARPGYFEELFAVKRARRTGRAVIAGLELSKRIKALSPLNRNSTHP
jgi:hypothetical protein